MIYSMVLQLVYLDFCWSGQQRNSQKIDSPAATAWTPITGFANESYHMAYGSVLNLGMYFVIDFVLS